MPPSPLSAVLRDFRRILRGNMLILFISWILLGFARRLTLNYDSLYFQALGADSVILGYITSASFAALALLQLVGGPLADTVGRRTIVVKLTFVMSFTILIFAFAPDWRYIMVGTVLMNLTLLYQPALFSMVMDSLPVDRRSTGFALINVASLPALAAPIIGGLVIESMGVLPGMRLLYLGYFFLALSAAVLRMRLRETLEVASHGKRASPLEVLRAWTRVDARMYAILAVGMLTTLGSALCMPFLVVYATEFISPLTWGVLMSVSVLLICLLPLPFGMLADARGRVALYVGGVAMLGVSYILFSLGGLLWFVLFTVLMSLGMAMYQAQQSAIMADIVESEVRGRVMGGYLFAVYVSGMVGGALGGYIYEASNPLPFIICGVLFLASALLLSLVFRKSRNPLG